MWGALAQRKHSPPGASCLVGEGASKWMITSQKKIGQVCWHFYCYNLSWRCYWHLVSRDTDMIKHPAMHRRSSHSQVSYGPAWKQWEGWELLLAWRGAEKDRRRKPTLKAALEGQHSLSSLDSESRKNCQAMSRHLILVDICFLLGTVFSPQSQSIISIY